MKFEPTESQRAALEAKGCVLVSAAAGSGKTAVLVERVIKMLTDPENSIPANRLLIVTFTNAAAAEMRSRIEARLYEELKRAPENELLIRQSYLIKTADICTIDSFCIKLVRDNFALCGIEPDFRVTDDKSLYLIRREVLNAVLGRYIDNPSADFLRLLELARCHKDESNLLNLIDALYISSKIMPFSSEYYSRFLSPYKEAFCAGHPWYDYTFSLARENISEARSFAGRLAEQALYEEKHDKATAVAESVAGVIDAIDEVLSSGDWDTAQVTLREAGLVNAPGGSSNAYKSIKATISDYIKQTQGLFKATAREISDELAVQAPVIKLLVDIITEFEEKLFERLKEENVFSFNDIEQLAMRMLASPCGNGEYVKTEQAKELICRYDEVLVDEFQDVNDLQNALFELLSDGGKKLFVVGDMKQCIYAFRGSNPDIFLKKKNEYSDYSSKEAGAKPGKRILLSENFRSRKGICKTVNFFFENLMIKEVGSLVYDKGEMLNPAATFADNGEVETDFLVIDKVDEADEDSVVESEGKAIARYITETMGRGRILSDKNGGLRSAGYGDFCVLLAAVKNKADVIAKELNACGIPAKVGGGEFFKSTEIIIARSLLKVISNPYSDVELLSVMMSPIYGFSAEEVARLRVGGRDKNLYSSLSIGAGGKKCDKLLADLSDFRRMSCMLTVDRLVSYVLDKTDMINVFYSLPGGDIRAENLIEFMRLASEFAGNSASGLYGFLKHLDSMEDTSFKIEPKADGDCVKIMTIHGSKGLQFPICIVAGLSYNIKKPDNRGYACNYSNEMGIGFKYYNRKDLKPREDFGYRLMEDIKNKGIAQERLRLLYVAFTRAEEKLCLISCLKDARSALDTAAEATNCGAKDLSGRYILSANNCSKYLLAMALTHPDAGVLRKVLGREVKLAKTDSRISFEFISTLSAGEGEAVKKEQAPDSELADKIKANINTEYKFKGLTGIPAKISVSALANKAEAERFAMADRPAFMEKDGLSAAGRGTAIHRIMQFIRFDGLPDIKSEIERLVREGRISENEAAAADTGKLNAFFRSDLYRRICASSDVRREMRFLTELPASYYGGEFEDEFIVQGAVDLCFTEPDGVVVVDFKTDRVDNADELKECYSGQISVYAKACEKIFKMPVKEKIIYSFNLSQAINV